MAQVMIEPGSRVKVLLPLPVGNGYDYLLPPDLPAETGAFVAVPLGRRVLAGVIWGEGGDPDLPAEKLREVIGILPVPPLPRESRALIDWLSAYYLCPPGSALRMAMSVPAALEPAPTSTAYRLGAPPRSLRATPARKRVLAAAADGFARSAPDLAREAGVSTGVVTGLAKSGALEAVEIPDTGHYERPDPYRRGPELSPDQAGIAAILRQRIADGGFSADVIDGVTGSGKTEVYFEAIAAALAQGLQVLVLLPEIALSAQWLDRFAARFGTMPMEWHSELSQKERRRGWRAVAEGRARVVVGARSALHLPYPELGLIVVDEEHEPAFKQEDGIAYNGRDMAVVRARIGDIPVVLCSATPSLETVLNIREGRYHGHHLKSRHGEADLPGIGIIDIRRDRPGRQQWISPPLRAAIGETVAAGEQALLFLNRRGYAPLTLCRGCGHRLNCPNCTAWLVEHRYSGRLQCHHCGYAVSRPEICPSCEARDSFAACGPGVERLFEEVTALFPDARIDVITSDTVHGPKEAAAFVERMNAGEIDILIGTQIVAKGYHFPMLTLVGVIDADLGLSGGDLRAAERTYQLLQQVAGRAGREGRAGRVLLQTANPESRVIETLAADDRAGFIDTELAEREALGFPPYGRLAAVIVSSMDAAAADRVCGALARAAPRADGLDILGPAPAPLAILRGRHRRRFLMRADRGISVQKALAGWIGRIDAPSSVRLQVDIDPYSFL